MFNRKRRRSDAEEPVASTPDSESGATDDAPEQASQGEVGVEVSVSGPFDADNVPDNGVQRIDLGSIRIAGFQDLAIHFEGDPASGRFNSVLATYQDGALRIQPLAAPRSGGLWADMRGPIVESIKEAGGDVAEVPGTFGPELHGEVPANTPEGEVIRQPIRLVGVEGPRWLLHGVFMGSAAVTPRVAELFEDVLLQTVVVRGSQPMAPGEVLPIKLPPDAQPAPGTPNAQADETTIGPPEPGVHITETR